MKSLFVSLVTGLIMTNLFLANPAQAVDTERIFDSTVTVKTGTSTGSAVFIDYQTLLTAAHVVEGFEIVELTRQEPNVFKSKAQVLYLDTKLDLAVLKSEDLSSNSLPIATTNPQLNETVYAAGSPVGETVVSRGEYKGIAKASGKEYGTALITIDHGSSGGPILNENDEIIGISLQGYVSSNKILFAQIIDINKVIEIAKSQPAKQSDVAPNSDSNSVVSNPMKVKALLFAMLVLILAISVIRFRTKHKIIKIRIEE